jgi:hypothetical protein
MGTWGGRRPGSGRKPKSAREKAVTSARVLNHPSSAPPVMPAEPQNAPNGLAPDVVTVWEILAPKATANQTLTAATAYAFEVLCRSVVLERLLAMAEPGSANHRGLLKEVNTRLLQFNLAPCGKPMPDAAEITAEQPKNPLAKFRPAR